MRCKAKLWNCCHQNEQHHAVNYTHNWANTRDTDKKEKYFQYNVVIFSHMDKEKTRDNNRQAAWICKDSCKDKE